MLVNWYQSDVKRCYGNSAAVPVETFIENLEDKFEQYGIVSEFDKITTLIGATVNPARSKLKRVRQECSGYEELKKMAVRIYAHPMAQNQELNRLMDLTLEGVRRQAPEASEGDAILLLTKQLTDSLPGIPRYARSEDYLVEALNRALRNEAYVLEPLYWSARTFDEKCAVLQSLGPTFDRRRTRAREKIFAEIQ